MSTKEEIDSVYRELHARLTKMYYVDKKIDKELFERLHTAVWCLHEKECINNGVMEDFIVDEKTGGKRSEQIKNILDSLGGEDELRKELADLVG